MVERLKVAVAKARAERARVTAGAAPAPKPVRAASGPATAPAVPVPPLTPEQTLPDQTAPAVPDATGVPDADAVANAWAALEPITLDPRHLERNRVITEARDNPAHVAFDVLRTRILRVFRKHGWTRLGITSPGKGCGKTFVSANLALSLARQPDKRTILMDLDLRAPNLANVLGVRQPDSVQLFLTGEVSAGDYLCRVGANLALGLNDRKVANAAETLLAPRAEAALDAARTALQPDIMVYDLPPMLACDDVLGLLPQLDCVLLVAGGGRTRPDEITECERLLADQTHLLGVLLNEAEDAGSSRYGYDQS